jgi:hypothetical protein
MRNSKPKIPAVKEAFHYRVMPYLKWRTGFNRTCLWIRVQTMLITAATVTVGATSLWNTSNSA